ncbi:MAG: WD40/YVTN/BNR-like repeat-containing protein, partial [Acidobacteriota bacterium]
AFAGVPGDRHTFYMGSTGGGVWRTTDAGETWVSLTDGQIDAGGIGAIALAPSDPNVIYMGTGSACIRGNVSPGIGAYRSTDAGETWEFIGLPEAGQIGDILVHPTDPDTVWVAALGNAFGPNEMRGVFRSTDGGESWEKVLYLDERSGVVDLSMHPTNPRILYAGAWGGAERKPWTLLSGSESGGIYRSKDGGDTWDKLAGGLPAGLVGKTAVEVSPANPRRVWALVEHADAAGLYRSDDGGESWSLISEDHSLYERPWYYMHIAADPNDDNTVWVSNVFLQKSIDGGESWEPVATPHPDHHGLWIHPEDSDVMLSVNDGGATVSLTGGETWTTQRNQPTAELYRVTVDDQFPYRLYAGQQDNSTISVPSRLPPSMISDFEDEYQFGGGESADVAIHPDNPDIVYAGSYGGVITRWDRETGQSQDVVAYPQLQLAQRRDELRYRYQWNAPILASQHEPGVFYHAAQVVLRTDDGGHSWREISPDLTTDDPEHQDYAGGPITRDGTGVEVYNTVFALEESPHTAGVLWAGTDDGRLHVTRDGGGSWTEVTPPELPDGATINSIDPSVHQDGRVLIAAYRYREADHSPYLFATDDWGETWRDLAPGDNGIPDGHFTRVLREDPDRRGLLYAGTEFGIYVSFDDGEHWQPFGLNMPATPITDLEVHRQDLVVATQGRSFWILDDLTPLHALSDEVLAADAWLAEPAEAMRINAGGFALGGRHRAEQDPTGAILHYALGSEPEGPVEIEVVDPRGEVAKTFSSEPSPTGVPPAFQVLAEAFGISLGGGPLPTEPGLHRVVWDLRYPRHPMPPGAVIFGFPTGALAVPGDYTVRLKVGEETIEQPLTVVPDPRVELDQAGFRAQFDFLMEVEAELQRVTDAVTRVHDLRSQIDDVLSRAERVGVDPEPLEQLRESGEALKQEFTAIEEEFVQTQSRSWEDPLNYPGKITAHLAHLHSVANGGADATPTAGSIERLEDLRGQIDDVMSRLATVTDTELSQFNERAEELGLPAVLVAEDARAEE